MLALKKLIHKRTHVGVGAALLVSLCWLYCLPIGLAHKNVGGAYGYVDTTGKLVVSDREFHDAGNFCEGLARVRVGEHYGFLSTNGKLVIPAKFLFE